MTSPFGAGPAVRLPEGRRGQHGGRAADHHRARADAAEAREQAAEAVERAAINRFDTADAAWRAEERALKNAMNGGRAPLSEIRRRRDRTDDLRNERNARGASLGYCGAAARARRPAAPARRSRTSADADLAITLAGEIDDRVARLVGLKTGNF